MYRSKVNTAMFTFNALYESIWAESGNARIPVKGLGEMEDCKPLVITLRILTRSMSGFFVVRQAWRVAP